jgi:hydrogenase expression/formation protein HypE
MDKTPVDPKMEIPVKVDAYRVRLVLFDFDGTLTRPGALDFKIIRKMLGCPDRMPVLEFIRGIPDAVKRRRARAALDRFESRGAAASRPNDGAESLVHWLKGQGLAVAIITRNSRPAVDRALQNFSGLGSDDFDLILTRDDPVPPKPAGDGVLYAAGLLGVDVREVLVVGDFLLDMQAGRAAGALTVLLDPQDDPQLAAVPCDYRIRQLDALRPIVRDGLPCGVAPFRCR